MKCRIWNLIIVTTLLSMFSVASIFSPASPVKAATTAGDTKARRLEGTWRVEVAIRNCQTGEALRTFPSFLTFLRVIYQTNFTTFYKTSSLFHVQ